MEMCLPPEVPIQSYPDRYIVPAEVDSLQNVHRFSELNLESSDALYIHENYRIFKKKSTQKFPAAD